MKVPFFMAWFALAWWGFDRLITATSWAFMWQQMGIALATAVCWAIGERVKM